MTRREWSDLLCRRLGEVLAAETPPGLGRWEGAWELVDGPSRELLDVLAVWERTGAREDKLAAITAAQAVVGVWREAAVRWDEAGRPSALPNERIAAPAHLYGDHEAA